MDCIFFHDHLQQERDIHMSWKRGPNRAVCGCEAAKQVFQWGSLILRVLFYSSDV